MKLIDKVMSEVKREIARLEGHINEAKQQAADAHALQRQPSLAWRTLEDRMRRLESYYHESGGKFWERAALDRSRDRIVIGQALSNASYGQLITELKNRIPDED